MQSSGVVPSLGMKKAVLLNLAAGVSLLMAITVLAAWGLGRWGYDAPEPVDYTQVGGRNTGWFLASNGWTLRLIRQHITTRSDDPGDIGSGQRLGFLYVYNNGVISHVARFGPHEPGKTFLGFAYDSSRFRRDYHVWRAGNAALSSTFFLDAMTIAIPWWFMLLATALPPVLVARRLLSDWHRQAHGLCRRCGYDLRETPGRCPECGAVMRNGEAVGGQPIIMESGKRTVRRQNVSG